MSIYISILLTAVAISRSVKVERITVNIFRSLGGFSLVLFVNTEIANIIAILITTTAHNSKNPLRAYSAYVKLCGKILLKAEK